MEVKKQRSNVRICSHFLSVYVQVKGLEPPRLSAPDPKSGAAANYATCAFQFRFAKKCLFGLKKTVFQKTERKFREYLIGLTVEAEIAL